MTSEKSVLVYGAYGHTGRFVAAELRRRGWTPVHGGRDEARLVAARGAFSHEPVRAAAVDDPDALARAAEGCVAVLNCAGPFEDTAAALIRAAIRNRVPYVDVAAEPAVITAIFTDFADEARAAGVSVIPAAGFYGALGDLLAVKAMADWREADTVSVAYALSGWRPTPGTRAVMQRRPGQRPVFTGGRIEVRTGPPTFGEHLFPTPEGRQTVMADYPGCESALLPSHLTVSNIEVSMAVAAIRDLQDPASGGPVAVDASGRSDQSFMVHVEVTRGAQTRTAWARGRDIYASTAPILVEAMERTLAAPSPGVAAVGEAFDAEAFLHSLRSDTFDYGPGEERTSARRLAPASG